MALQLGNVNADVAKIANGQKPATGNSSSLSQNVHTTCNRQQQRQQEQLQMKE